MKFQSIPLPPREAPSEGPQAYSAIVYYDNPHVVARNSKGSLIDSGIAYEDDEKVIQSAIDSLSEGLVLVRGVDPTTVSVTEKDKVKVAFYYQGIPRYTSVHTENIYNIADYIVDSSSELVDAFNNLSDGETIYIGSGTYTVSSTLKADVSNVKIIGKGGKGNGATTITRDGNFDLIDLSGASDHNNMYNYIEGVQLDGNNKTGKLLNLSYNVSFQLNRVHWLNAADVGVYVYNCAASLLYNCESHDCYTNIEIANLSHRISQVGCVHFYNSGHSTPAGEHPIMRISGGPDGSSNSNSVVSCQFEHRSSDASEDPIVVVGSGTANTFCSQTALLGLNNCQDIAVIKNVDDQPDDTVFDRCSIELGTRYGIRVLDSGRVHVTGYSRLLGSSTADLSRDDTQASGSCNVSTECIYDSIEGTWKSGVHVRDLEFVNEQGIKMTDSAGNIAYALYTSGDNVILRNDNGQVRILDLNGNLMIKVWDGEVDFSTSAPALPTLSSDPWLAEGTTKIYVSDGSADVTGDDGDVILAVNSGGTTKTKILADFSAL